MSGIEAQELLDLGVANATNDVQALIDAGQQSSVNGKTYAALAERYRIVDLEEFADSPRRIVRRKNFSSPRSYIDYCQPFKTNGSRVFGNQKNHSFECILDDHLPQKPSHGDHCARLTLEKSHEWKTWLSKDGESMTQVDFARFIESNARDIAEPAGAALLDLVKDLELSKSTKFKSAVRLQDGQRVFELSEEIRGLGQVAIPETFTLGLYPFEVPEIALGERGDVQKFKLVARLRYRIDNNGKLSLYFELDRPDIVLQAAFISFADLIERDLGLKPLF